LPQQNNFFGFVAGPKEKSVCGEKKPQERKKEIHLHGCFDDDHRYKTRTDICIRTPIQFQ